MKVLILANNEVGLLKFRKELLIQLISLGHCVTVCLPIEESLQELHEIGCKVINLKINRRGKNYSKWKEV